MKVVYNSFSGRFSDNPRALYEQLCRRRDLTHLWLADPRHRDSFPTDVVTVDIDSDAAVEALQDADLLISNSHTEVEWTKPPQTTYLQTWHGTPLKRIHRDVLWAPEGRLDRLDRDVEKWDLLLSPNSASTPRLRQAFSYDGEVLESGYPRNDVLSDPARETIRGVVRKELGLADDITAVLYTPTWRDDECFQDGLPEVAMALDFERLTEELGPSFCVLPRLHNMMTGRFTPARLPGVVDVSYYPDLRDLYLAADVLMTDYSSAMFDFAITGKPIVFYAYDLPRFRDSIRGFYFDFVPEAPGPIAETTDEVVEILGALPARTSPYVERYDRFADTYCHLEDGRASQRVLGRLEL